MSEAPCLVALRDLVAQLRTGPFGSSLHKHEYVRGGVPLINPMHINGGRLTPSAEMAVSEAKAHSLADFALATGDVVIARRGEMGRCAVVAPSQSGWLIGTGSMALTPGRDLLPEFLRWFLGSPESVAALEANAVGSTMANLNQGVLLDLEIPVLSVRAQGEVVAKLDALTARTARARADLDRVPIMAERQRQAALAAAFSGDLTRSWREYREREMPTGHQLLTELAAHRGSLDEGRQSARRGPPGDPETGRQPVAIDAIPASWAVADLERITDPRRLIQYGILKPGDHREGGVPYVKVMNIRGGRIELDRIRKTTPEIHAAYRRSALKAGDLLLTIRGTVGRVGLVPNELDGGNITQDSVRIAVLPGVEARLVYWFLQSPAAQEYFRANQKGVAVRGINVGDVRPMEIPIPPIEEQREIVRRLDHAFTEIDRLVAEAAAARRLLDRLDQAILAKAFRGELVPQDPADEPASVLLERIRAERIAAPGPRRARRQTAEVAA